MGRALFREEEQLQISGMLIQKADLGLILHQKPDIDRLSQSPVHRNFAEFPNFTCSGSIHRCMYKTGYPCRNKSAVSSTRGTISKSHYEC